MDYMTKLLVLHAIAVMVLSVSVATFLYALIAICSVLDQEDYE